MEKMLTVAEAAEVIGVHPNTVRNLIKSGKLKSYRIGEKIIRVSREDLRALYRESSNVR